MKKPPPVSPLMQELSSHMAAALRRKLPRDAAERGRLHVLDTVAAIISGSRLPPGKHAISYVKLLGGKPEASVMGARMVTNAANAALANGMCAHADETDDVHPPTRTHPGATVVPAALAVAERQHLSGKMLLRAVVLGYDICARVLLALRPIPLFLRGHHACCFGGVFGATAAAGALLGLDSRQMRHALSYSSQHASGTYTLLRDTLHVEKAYGVGGMPACHGVMGALMVASGCSGVEDVFSGKPDFFSIFSEDPDREALIRGLGREYEILRVRIKRWPVGGPIQGPLHVLDHLMRKYGFKAEHVAKLVARVPENNLVVVNDRDMPDISLQHLLAVMLVDGKVTFDSAHDFARMNDTRIIRLREVIHAVGEARPAGAERDWRAAIEVTLKDGQTLAHQTTAPDATFDAPVPRAQVQEKALDLLAPILGKKQSSELISALLDIETLEDVRSLRRLYVL